MKKTASPQSYTDPSTRRTLTEQQRKIIVSVQHRGQSEVAEIAKLAGESVATTRYQLALLADHGILQTVAPFISIYPLGLVSVTVYLSFTGLSESKHKSVVQSIIQHPSVSWVARLAGGYDYAVAVLTARGSEAYSVLSHLTEKFGPIVSKKTLLTTCGFTAQVRRYLAPSIKAPPPLYFGFEDPIVEIDELDSAILAKISANGITSQRSQAAELGISHMTLGRRITELQKLGIIKGYITRFDMSSLHLDTYRIHLNTAATHPAITKQIRRFSENELFVLRTIETLGPWDYALEVEVPSIKDLTTLVERLKQHLENVLINIDTVQILEHLCYRPFPQNLSLPQHIYSKERLQ